MARSTLSIHIGRGEPPSVYWQDFIPADDAWMEGVFLPDRHGVGGGENRQYHPVATRQALGWAGLPLVYTDHLLASPFAFTVSAEVARRAQEDWLAAWARYRDCTSDTPSGDPRLGLRLSAAGVSGGGSQSRKAERRGVAAAQLSLRFGGSSSRENLPHQLSPVCLELFAVAKQFSGVLPGPEGGNFRWTFDPQQINYGPYFESYGRRLLFPRHEQLDPVMARLVMDRVADLYVIWAFCPIPASVASRVDPKQEMNYEVDSRGASIGIRVVLELLHVESGDYRVFDLNEWGFDAPGLGDFHYMQRDDWTAMSMDEGQVIRHGHVDRPFLLQVISPTYAGLPPAGAVRARCMLLGTHYFTGSCTVSSNAIGTLGGDRRMSTDALWLSKGPTTGTYSPGRTEGLMPPVEFEWPTRIADGIEFDAVFDLKYLTTFRFVVKVTNNHDFAVGVVVSAGALTAWAQIPARSTRYLGGSVLLSASTLSLNQLYPHPENIGDPFSVLFRLYLTKPMNPDVTPADLLEKEVAPTDYRSGVKVYSHDGTCDKIAFNSAGPLQWLGPVIERPAPLLPKVNLGAVIEDANVGLFYINNDVSTEELRRSVYVPAGDFDINIATSGFKLWSLSGTHDVLCTGEYFVVENAVGGHPPGEGGSHEIGWAEAIARATGYPVTVDSKSSRSWGIYGELWGYWIPCTAMVRIPYSVKQEFFGELGIDEAVVIHGADVQWDENASGVGQGFFADKFSSPGGMAITEASLRGALQTKLRAKFSGDYPIYFSNFFYNYGRDIFTCSDFRNLTIHPSVRFGVKFSDDSPFALRFGNARSVTEASALVDVSGLDDLDTLSEKFLCVVKPEYRRPS